MKNKQIHPNPPSIDPERNVGNDPNNFFFFMKLFIVYIVLKHAMKKSFKNTLLFSVLQQQQNVIICQYAATILYKTLNNLLVFRGEFCDIFIQKNQYK